MAVSQPKITTFFSSGETKTSEQSQNHEQNKVPGDSDAESSSSYDTEYESDLNAVSELASDADFLEQCIIFIDFHKAFDTLEFNFIHNCLKEFGFGETLLIGSRLFILMYVALFW